MTAPPSSLSPSEMDMEFVKHHDVSNRSTQLLAYGVTAVRTPHVSVAVQSLAPNAKFVQNSKIPYM